MFRLLVNVFSLLLLCYNSPNGRLFENKELWYAMPLIPVKQDDYYRTYTVLLLFLKRSRF